MSQASQAFGLSRKGQRTPDSPISDLMARALANPGLISLAAGFVDQESLPTAAVRHAVDLLMDDPVARGRPALQYGTTSGNAALRERVLSRFERLESVPRQALGLSADDVVVTSGSQQMLYLAAEALLDEGDIVINSAPSYFVFTSLLAGFGADVRSVPDDAGGMCPDRLDALLASLDASGDLPRVKMIYVITYFQNPGGVSVAPERRARIVEVARRWSRHNRILVLEDAAYRELRFEGPETGSLKRWDPDNSTVLYTTTFSKPFAPGLKVGWSLVPRSLRRVLLRIKGNHDFGTAQFPQAVAEQALADGSYDRQVDRLTARYGAKRDAMLDALAEHFPTSTGAEWAPPHGGLYVWFALPAGCDASMQGPLFDVAVRNGVLYVPGDLCYTPQPGFTVPLNRIRLSFGVAGEADIAEGIRRFAKACAEVWPGRFGASPTRRLAAVGA